MKESKKEFDLSVFKVLFENMPDGCVLVDKKGLIHSFNPMILDMFGYSSEELTGKPIELLMSQHKSAKHINDRMAFYKSPQKRQMGRRGIDLFARKKSGTLFPVDISLSPLEIDKELFILTVIRDVTENFELKKQLLRSNELWNSLSSNSTDIISVLDNEGRILSINKIPDYFLPKNISIESIIGKYGSGYFQLDSAVKFKQKFKRVLIGKKPERFDVQDEQGEWYEISLIPIFKREQIDGIILTAKLITEQKMAEENRVHAQREKIMAIIETQENERSRISYDLHDGLGQVLASLNMFVISLEDHLKIKDEQARSIFSTVKELTQRSIKECRAISHNLQPKNLMESGVEAALREMHRNFPDIKDNVKIIFNVSDSFSKKRYSKEKEMTMYRVIQEITHNTIKHAFANYLKISFSCFKGQIIINTEDDGKGIDPEVLAKGGGIGLTGIKKRIQDINGTLEVITILSGGTKFYISIPEN